MTTAPESKRRQPRGKAPRALMKEEGTVTLTNDVTRVEKPWGYELNWAKTDR